MLLVVKILRRSEKFFWEILLNVSEEALLSLLNGQPVAGVVEDLQRNGKVDLLVWNRLDVLLLSLKIFFIYGVRWVVLRVEIEVTRVAWHALRVTNDAVDVSSIATPSSIHRASRWTAFFEPLLELDLH